jgi:hypothetical protein
MPSDFTVSCKVARDAIAVPAFPLETIRAAYHRPRPRAGRRRAAVAAVVAGVSIAAAAAAADVFGGARVSLEPSGIVREYFDGTKGGWRPVRHPTEADFHAAARALNFPVTFPTGLPPGTTAEALTVLGPGAMHVVYDLPGAWRRSNHLLFVILANPSSVSPPGAQAPHTAYSLQFGQTNGAGAVRWRVGREEMIVMKSTMTPAELAHFKAAMTGR